MQEEATRRSNGIWRPIDLSEETTNISQTRIRIAYEQNEKLQQLQLWNPMTNPYEPIKYKHWLGYSVTTLQSHTFPQEIKHKPVNILGYDNSTRNTINHNNELVIDLTENEDEEQCYQKEDKLDKSIETHRKVRELSEIHSSLNSMPKKTSRINNIHYTVKNKSKNCKSPEKLVQHYLKQANFSGIFNKSQQTNINENENSVFKGNETKSICMLYKQNNSRRRSRTVFNDNQLETLLEEFAKNAYLVASQVDDLSEKLSLDPRVIQVWFKNHRRMNKQDKLKRPHS